MRRYKGFFPTVEASDYNIGYDYYPYHQVEGLNNQRPIYMPQGIEVPGPNDEDTEEADLQYMKSLYPDFCKKVQVYIEEECDRLEYDGSYMYDEYPDRDTIEKIADQILGHVKKDERIIKQNNDDSVNNQQLGYDNERDLIKLLLLNELFNRRRIRFYGGRRRRVPPYFPPYFFNYRRYFG